MTIGFSVGFTGIHFAGLPVGPTLVVPARIRQLVIDMQYGGDGVISGTVKKVATPMNLPLRRRVRLHDEYSGRLLHETVSSEIDGSYTFSRLRKGINYTLISYDSDRDFRAVIADRIQAS